MILYILLDAFRGDYITKKNTPFLYSLQENIENYHIKYVKPSHSFCERTEIFSGLTPLESYYFTAIGNNKNRSPYRKFKVLLNFLHLIENFLFKRGILNKVFRKLITLFFTFIGVDLKVYNIPLNQIHNYYLTEDYDDIRNHDFKSNIFKLIESKKLTHYFKTFTSLRDKHNLNDDERLNLALNNLDNDLIFLYIGDPDAKGHFYGPASFDFKIYLSKLDEKLKKFIKTFDQNTGEQASIIINGDHGMSQVTSSFDALEYLEKILAIKKFKKNIDYEIFLDSTLVRVWSLNSELKKLIMIDKRLNELGRFVYSNADSKFKNIYGDIIWTINQGGLIIPNYFQKTIIKGMHGYVPENTDDFGTLIIKNPKAFHNQKKSIKLTDVNYIIRKEIEERY